MLSYKESNCPSLLQRNLLPINNWYLSWSMSSVFISREVRESVEIIQVTLGVFSSAAKELGSGNSDSCQSLFKTCPPQPVGCNFLGTSACHCAPEEQTPSACAQPTQEERCRYWLTGKASTHPGSGNICSNTQQLEINFNCSVSLRQDISVTQLVQLFDKNFWSKIHPTISSRENNCFHIYSLLILLQGYHTPLAEEYIFVNSLKVVLTT